MWRAIVLLACLLAGCAEPTPSATTPPDASSALPFRSTGRLWLPEQNGPDPASAVIDFPVNSSGSVIAVRVRIGASLGAADSPSTISTVTVILLDPEGTEVARELHEPGPATSHEIGGSAPVAGVFHLVFECELTGGGAGTGDYADFDISATPQAQVA